MSMMGMGWAMAGAQALSYAAVSAYDARKARKATNALLARKQRQLRETGTGGMDPGRMRTMQTAGALQQQATQAGIAEEAARGTQGRGLTSTQLAELSAASAMGVAQQQSELDRISSMEAMQNAAARRAMQDQVMQLKYQRDMIGRPVDAAGRTILKTSGDYAGQSASTMQPSSYGQRQSEQAAKTEYEIAAGQAGGMDEESLARLQAQLAQQQAAAQFGQPVYNYGPPQSTMSGSN
jgi:hypothetical protein